MSKSEKYDETHMTEDATLAPESEPQKVKALPESLQLQQRVGTDECPYRPGGKWHKYEKKKFSAFFITQQAFYDGYGDLLTEERIQEALAPKGMTYWAYINHDRDTYTPKDFKSKYTPPKGAAVGDKKPAHWHIPLLCKSYKSIAAVAKAFGVPPQYVEGKPPSAFLPLCKYLTHEDPAQADKETYDRSEVVTNVPDLWEQVDEDDERRAQKKKVNVDEVSALVAQGKMTLAEVREKYLKLYVKRGMLAHLTKLRGDYLQYAPLPPRIVNILVYGDGGTGKDLMTGPLPHELGFLVFKIGGENVGFDGYDGEECVVWEDARAGSIIQACGNRGNAFRMFAPFRQPGDGRLSANIKYGRTYPIQQLNIVTAATTPDDFFQGLAGTYIDRFGRPQMAEDESQAYRRFQILIKVEKGQYTIYLNKGFFNGTREYFDYITVGPLSQNLEQLRRRAENIADPEEREAVISEIESRTVAPIVDIIKQILYGDPNTPTEDADALLADFADAGQQVTARTSRINPPQMDFAADAKPNAYFSRTDFLCTAICANPAAPPRAWLLDGSEDGQQHRILQVQNSDGTYTNYLAGLSYSRSGYATRTTGALDSSATTVSTAVANGVLVAGEPANSRQLCVSSNGKTYVWRWPGTDDKERTNLEVRISANTRDVIRVVSESNDSLPAEQRHSIQRYSAALVDSPTYVSLEQKVLNADEAVAVINRANWATSAVTDEELQQIFAAITAGGATS
ncbi:Rep family protein [Corynebacterium aurimucosum]|uniref:Rep family protein n=1 Tax=Corynebacterium aurimucosum TaxID=169292 RepID=UPI001C0EDCC1|nr:Rep family protein [Corynebacterium aurimucosum]